MYDEGGHLTRVPETSFKLGSGDRRDISVVDNLLRDERGSIRGGWSGYALGLPLFLFLSVYPVLLDRKSVV